MIPVILRTNQVPLSGQEASIAYKRIHPTQMIRHLACAFKRVQVGLVCLISVRPYCSNTQSEPSVAWYKTNCLGLASPSSRNIIKNISPKVNKVEERMSNRHLNSQLTPQSVRAVTASTEGSLTQTVEI